MKDFIEKLFERTHILVILLGIVLLLIGITDKANIGNFSLQVIDLWGRIMICVIGIILTIFGMILVWKKSQHTEKIIFTRTRVKVKIFSETEQVFDDAIKILGDAQKIIRASFFAGKDQTTPDKYIQKVAFVLRNSKDKGTLIEYRLVSNSDIHINQRLEVFKKYGVEDLFKYKFAKNQSGLSVLIIDDIHLHISFSELSVDKFLRNTIKLSKHKEFINNIARWYDTYLWENS